MHKMKDGWTALETGTHQDHVIAHVVGTTVFGYLIVDDAVHLLLDIGFIWTIYIDGSMALLPQKVAIAELALDEAMKAEVLADVTLLYDDGREAVGLKRMQPAPVDCLMTDVALYEQKDRRRLLLRGEAASLMVETSLADGEISVTGMVAAESDPT